MACAYGDENLDLNVSVQGLLGDAPASKAPASAAELPDAAEPARTPSRGREACGSPRSSAASPAPLRPQLEPSLQAWAASRPQSAALVRNIGASERSRGPASVVSDFSVGELSVQSRRSRLSQRSSSRRSLTTEEIDQIRIAQKRQEVKAMMRHNEVAFRAAIHGPEAIPNLAGSRSLQVTMPEEFSLSTPRISRGRSQHADEKEDAADNADWQRSLRKASRSKARGRSWRPQLTVPCGPQLSTEDRARSRSASSLRSTPASTPERRRAATPRCGTPLSAREQVAEEDHAARIALARRLQVLPSPLRRRSLSVGASPARSVQSSSDMSIASVASRVSRLSRPRSVSCRHGRPLLSTEELECLRAEEGRREIRAMSRSNSQNLPHVLAPPDPLKASGAQLTMPEDHEFYTERRARSRSVSVHSSTTTAPAELSVGTRDRLPLRERCAVERHLERATAGQILGRAGTAPRPAAAPAAADAVGASTEAQEAWVRKAPTREERAHRARIVAQAARAEVDRTERSRLCIFKRLPAARPAKAEAEAPIVADVADGPVPQEANPQATHVLGADDDEPKLGFDASA